MTSSFSPNCLRNARFSASNSRMRYCARYEREFEDEPGRWHYEIPSAYGLETIPRMNPTEF